MIIGWVMLPITYTGGHDPFLGSRQAIAFRHMFSNVHQQISTRIIIIKGHFWVRGVTCVGGGKHRRPQASRAWQANDVQAGSVTHAEA